MKQIICTAVFLTAVFFSQAQNNKGDITLAPYAGVSFARYTSNEDVDYNARFAATVGASVDFYLSDRWSIRTGLGYAALGTDDDFDNTDKINYLSIPLNANYHFGNKREWYFNFGFSGKFLLNAEAELATGEIFAIDDFIKSTDLGLDLGIGYKFRVSETTEFFGETQFYNGFIDILDVEADGTELRNAATFINVGVVFKL